MSPQEKILQAAQELFYKNGIKKVTMDDIAKSLGMSKKTIYQHFNEKDDLVMTFTKNSLEFQKKSVEAVAARSKDAIEEFMHLMSHSTSQFSQLHINLIYDTQKYYPEAWKLFHTFKENFLVGMIKRNLERGIKEKLYRKDINMDILSRLRVEETAMGLNPNVFPPPHFVASEVHLALLDHFVHGITTLKGHQLVNKYKHIHEEE